MILVLVSLVVLFCDYRYHYFSALRNRFSLTVASIQDVVYRPLALAQIVADNFTTKKAALKENAKLRLQLSSLNVELQRLDFLERENAELRTLLNYSKQLKVKILPARLLTSVADSFNRQATIDSGSKRGAAVGQPVLDAYGLFGQVVLVDSNLSIVMPITNIKSAIPVMVPRNGLQTIALGAGNGDALELANVPETADIQRGDLLTTSGLGGIFPAGYKVGVVKEVKRVVGERFIKVMVTPAAHLNTSRYVFLTT